MGAGGNWVSANHGEIEDLREEVIGLMEEQTPPGGPSQPEPGSMPPPPPPSEPMTPPPPPGGAMAAPVMAKPESASGKAIAALILGIVGLFCLPTAIVAWILGTMERRAIKRGESPAAGQTMATVGMVLGIIFTILGILGLILYVVLIGAAIMSGGGTISN